ncbi:MAG: G5 domain-containing protein [Clostridia bacterium]|nr:G5 domain-containing protein [Clostridia bacterium]
MIKFKAFLFMHRHLLRAVCVAFAFALAAGITFNIMVKPYAVYADGTKVEDPYIVSADGEELFIVEDEDTAEQVVRDVMEYYTPEDGDVDSIKLEEELKIEDKPLFIGVKPPTVITEEEAVEKVLASNDTDEPMMHVTTASKVDEKKTVKPETVYEKTDELFEGNTELKSEGKEGEKIVTNEVVMVNGEEKSEEPVEEEVIKDPVDTVMYLGTKARPHDTAWADYSGEPFGTMDGMELVNFGKQFLGNPYKWGGTSLTNGTDCSGFIYSCYQHFGYDVPRMGFYKMGKGVCLAEAQPGDVIYYPGHYAMYAGNGMIVHAYNSHAGICMSSVHAPGKILTIRRFVEK